MDICTPSRCICHLPSKICRGPPQLSFLAEFLPIFLYSVFSTYICLYPVCLYRYPPYVKMCRRACMHAGRTDTWTASHLPLLSS